MTLPISDLPTEELVLPAPASEPAPARHRLEWIIVLAVLALALAATVALLATLWLRPGSGSVGQ